MTSVFQKFKSIAPTISDAFYFLFKLYLLFFFVFIILETEEPRLVSGHISLAAWAMATVGIGLIAFLADYLQPREKRLSLVGRSNILYTILLTSCILIWIMLSLRERL